MVANTAATAVTAAMIDRKIDELRAATRAANEALADLKAERKALERDVNQARQLIQTDMHERLEEAARREMEALGKQLAEHRDRALDKIMRSMDEWWALLIGAKPGLPHGDILPILKARLERIDQRLGALEGRRR
jgi:predicted RNase H-like nuclease (RuvC/YqgF family)